MMDQKINDEFLITCKQNYFDKITPSNKLSPSKEGYKKIVRIAHEYFKNGKYEEFSGFFQEGQYFIELWAAHMLLEYGTPTTNLMTASAKIIRKYSDNALALDVAEEEREWLKTNSNKYKEYFS